MIVREMYNNHPLQMKLLANSYAYLSPHAISVYTEKFEAIVWTTPWRELHSQNEKFSGRRYFW